MIVNVKLEHVKSLAENMRTSDKVEIAKILGFFDSYYTINKCLENSVFAGAGVVDGDTVCIFGVSRPASAISVVYAPWMLTSELLNKHKKQFVAESAKVFKMLCEDFPYMVNYVDVENKKVIRWLKAIGFNFDKDPVIYGMAMKPFYRFWYGGING